MTELYKAHRPKDLEDVVGQPQAVKILLKYIEHNRIPHALLFTGPSGCGKTTIARILRKHVKCKPQSFTEVNCADIRGIENVRDIRRRMALTAIGGGSKIWLIDEAHRLTSDAQNALLKMMEDTPRHVYFMLATTEPARLIRTIRTRCTEIALKPIGEKDLVQLIISVWNEEKKDNDKSWAELSDAVVDKIIQSSEGSARKALVLLDSVIQLDSEEDMLEAIEKSTQEGQAIQLCRMMLNWFSWADMAKLLKELEGEDAEGLRRMMLGYMRSVLLGGSKIAGRAAFIIGIFERNFFDSGNAGLALACWEAMNAGK